MIEPAGASTPQRWSFVSTPAIHNGFAYGSRYPSLVFAIGGPALPANARRRAGDAIASVVEGFSLAEIEPQTSSRRDAATKAWDDTLAWLLQAIDGLQRACELPVCEPARRLSNADDAGAGARQANFGKTQGEHDVVIPDGCGLGEDDVRKGGAVGIIDD